MTDLGLFFIKLFCARNSLEYTKISLLELRDIELVRTYLLAAEVEAERFAERVARSNPSEAPTELDEMPSEPLDYEPLAKEDSL